MKVIVLHAFGGLLVSGYIPVQSYPKDYRVPLLRRGDPWGGNWAKADMSLDPVSNRTAVFVPTGKFVVMENKNTAQVYELESM